MLAARPEDARSALATPLRFLAAGGIAAVVNFGSRIALSSFIPYAAAIVIAFCFGMTCAFLLNKRFVFESSSNSLGRQMLWFVAINLFALAQTLIVSLVLADWLLPLLGITWHAQELAHAAGIAVPIVTSYLAHKRLTFRR